MGVNKMNMKWTSLFIVLLVAVLAMSTVSAQIVEITEVELDDDELSTSDSTTVRQIERNDEWEVKVHFTALEDLEEVEVEVRITGVGDDDLDVRDTEYVDEVYANTTYVEKLTLDMPYKVDQGEYLLKIRVDGANSETVSEYYSILVEAEENGFVIKDVTFSPGQEIEAGRALLTTVRIENIGDEDDDEGVKVEVEIPELGLSASDYLDEVDEDDSISSEELYMRIPSTTEAGDYDLTVTVTFDDGDETVSEDYTVTVTADETTTTTDDEDVSSKTIITVGPEEQDVTAGQGGVVYPITLTNAEGDAKTYVLDVEGCDTWGTVRLDPSNVVVLGAGETEAVYLFVSANEGVSGLQSMVVSVSSDSETLKEFVLRANVVAGESTGDEESATGWESVKTGLEIGLIVLVVLLIILGLIIAVNKLRGNDEDEDDLNDQTYY